MTSIEIFSNVVLDPLDRYLRAQSGISNAWMAEFDTIFAGVPHSRAEAVLIHFDILNARPGYTANLFDINADESLTRKLMDSLDFLESQLDQRSNKPHIVATTLSTKAIFSDELKSYQPEFISRYNSRIGSMTNSVIDLDELVTRVGVGCISPKNYIRFSSPYNDSFLGAYAASVSKALSYKLSTKKVLVLDLDNTYWGGIIAEDDISSIDHSSNTTRGAIFHQIQCMCKSLLSRGVILSICSKNDVARIEQSFDRLSIIPLSDFSFPQINMGSKAENLEAIARALGLSLDSFVFIDDSSFEINEVRSRLPHVTCYQVAEDVYQYPRLFREVVINHFQPSFSSTKEDSLRVASYQQNQKREQASRLFTTYSEYLDSLGTEIFLYCDEPSTIKRAVQLSARTNQFNLTTKRYNTEELEAIAESEYERLFMASVSDRYGDFGFVGMVVVSRLGISSTTPVIKSFLLSCRVLNRDVEWSIIHNIFTALRDMGYKECIIEFRPNQRNKLAASFLSNSSKLLVISEDYKPSEDLYEYRVSIDFTASLVLKHISCRFI